MVLVGGEGTRLRPLTLTTPKQMLPVGRPAHDRAGPRPTWPGTASTRPCCPSATGRTPSPTPTPTASCAGVALTYAVEDDPLDTAGAIRFAARSAGIDETFVVVNGDVLTDLDVTGLVAFHRDRGAEATVALTPVEDPSAFGVVPTDDEGGSWRSSRSRRPGRRPTNLINAGTYVLEPSVLARIPGDRRVSIERETFPALVRRRAPLRPRIHRPTGWTPARRPPSWPPTCATPAPPRRRMRRGRRPPRSPTACWARA